VLPISEIPAPIRNFATAFKEVFNHQSQEEHFCEYLTGLIASGNRTVAGIHQRLISATDYDSLHHFMTDSPWSAEKMREKRFEWIKSKLPAQKEHLSVIAIDSTFIHHTGEKIHGVYWYWDYTKKQFCLAQRVVLASLVTPSKLIPLGSQIYHRGFLREQKLYLEATMPAADADIAAWEEYNALVRQYEENCKQHKTQLEIAADLVDECEKYGFNKEAYVLDGAFVDQELMGKIEKYGQAWVSRLAKNRLVQARGSEFESIESFGKSLSKDAFKPVKVRTRHGEERTYWCFGKNIMIKDWKKLRVVISYDNQNLDGEPIYLISNKTNWIQAYKILQSYMMRDPIEHLIRDEKQELGFEDGQQRKPESVLKHWEMSFAAHTFLELGLEVNYPEGMPVPKLETIGQKCRFLESQLLQSLIRHIKALVLEQQDTKELIEFLTRKRLNRLAH
jgi:SRSO17 transposase